MKFIATFETAEGVEKSFIIGDSMDLQDAFNVVANNHLTTKNITLSENHIEMRNPENTTPHSNKTYKGVFYFTPKEIQEKHNLSKKEVEKLLNEGADHELEHTDDYLMAQYIASSHLYETPNYYKRLNDLKLAKGNLMKTMAKGGKVEDDLESKLDYILNLKPLYPHEGFKSNKENIGGFTLRGFFDYHYDDISTQFYKLGIELNEDFSYLQRGKKFYPQNIIAYVANGDKVNSVVLTYDAVLIEDDVVYEVFSDEDKKILSTSDEDEAESMAESIGGYVEVRTFEKEIRKNISNLLVDINSRKLVFIDKLSNEKDEREFKKGGLL